MFNSEHKFKTEKQSKKGNTIRFICAFLAFLLVFGSVSVYVMLKNNNLSLKELLNKNNDEETSQEAEADEAADAAKQISGCRNYLFMCSSSSREEIYFMAVVAADMDNKTFRVLPVSCNSSDYISELKTGGEKGLKAAVEKKLGISIYKYAASNAETFALAVNYMGGLEYTVPSRIDYKGQDDFTLILTNGAQTIKGDDLIKYFRYAETLGADGLKTQGNLICAMLDNYINSENTENGLNIFEKLLSKINSKSDINHVEAAEMISTLKKLCKSGVRTPSTVISATSELEFKEESKK